MPSCPLASASASVKLFKVDRLPQFSSDLSDIWLACAQQYCPQNYWIRILNFCFNFYPSALWAGGVLSSRSGRAGGCQNLWHPYLWNRLTDFLRSKFCGIVLACSCALSLSFAHLPLMGMPIGQKLVKFATNCVQTLWHAYLWNCWMDLPHLKFHGLV